MPNNIIETLNLTKHFDPIRAIDGINLKVPKNSIFGFLGPNGSGKTTTIKLLLGLQKPTNGSAEVFGKDIVKDGLEIRQRIGYLAQDPAYHEHMTARQILNFRAKFYYKDSKDAIQNRVAESIELVDLDDKADRPIKGFSEGEKQRLGIAQAQINHPDLLILDEPVSSLDPMGRRDVLNIMKDLREHSTIFYSTHILDDVQRVSTHVAILKRGCLVTQAPIDDLLTGENELLYYITVKGDHKRAYGLLKSQDWVTGVTLDNNKDKMTLKVTVNDNQAAEDDLLRLIVNGSDSIVINFGQQEHELEEIFMNMVEVQQ